MTIEEKIKNKKTFLGIELGSTRIKAALTDDSHKVIASGSFEWENRFENGYWTYSLDDIHEGIRACYADLVRDIRQKYQTVPDGFGAIGISAMMHGYMAFDKDGVLLTPFRTWRNTTTARAAQELTDRLGFNIPQRWTAAHLYQALLDGEEHVSRIEHTDTLAVYIHRRLTNRREAGIGEASGIFPIKDGGYDEKMLAAAQEMFREKGFDRQLKDLFPTIRQAGEKGAYLTQEGAAFLDPTGVLKAGVPICPPEGDAGTGMTAANAVRPGTGNVSAGTSVFAMPVLEKPLNGVYPQIDVVCTPDGSPAAMVHCNNCCSEIDAWVRLFGEFARLIGRDTDKSELYKTLYGHAMTGDKDCGELTVYNFLSGEPVADTEQGRPMFFRTPSSSFDLANFMRAQLYGCIAALKMGMDILREKEGIVTKAFTAHGGLFKVKGAAQQILADALDTPTTVNDAAGEGGAWGMALLAEYMTAGGGRSLADWLDEEVFSGVSGYTLSPDKDGVKGFEKYMERYRAGLAAEKMLGEVN